MKTFLIVLVAMACLMVGTAWADCQTIFMPNGSTIMCCTYGSITQCF